MFSAFFLSAWIFFATSLGPPTTSHLDGAWSYLTSDFCCCEINWELWSVISPRKKTPGIRWRRTCCLDIYFLYIIVIHDVMPLEESVIQEFSHIIPHPYLWWRWPRFLCARRRLFPLGITFGNQFQPLLHSSESLLFKQKKYRRKLGQNLVKTLEVMGWKTTKKTPQKKSMKKNSFSGNKFGGWESCIPEASPHLKAATLRWLVTLVVNSLCVCVCYPPWKPTVFQPLKPWCLKNDNVPCRRPIFLVAFLLVLVQVDSLQCAVFAVFGWMYGTKSILGVRGQLALAVRLREGIHGWSE